MQINKNNIDKYLKGQCTEAEIFFIENWYTTFEKKNDGLSDLTIFEQNEIKNKIKEKIDQKINFKIQNRPITLSIWSRWVVGIAASILIVSTLTFYWQQDSPTNIDLKKANAEMPLSMLVKYENQSPKILKVSLPDSSVVWLQPKTTLSYNQSDSKFRQLTMIGEAFFDVKHDEKRPFLIFTGKMTTKVLGTSFNIKAYENMAKYEVSVVSGKVAVSNENEKELYVTPKQQVLFENINETMAIINMPLDKTEYWELANMAYSDAPLQQIAANLSQNFNIKITLSKALNNCRLSGNFNQSKLPTVLEVICKTIGAEYELIDNQIFIKGDRCN